MRTVKRDIISLKRWNELVEKGVITLIETKFGKNYGITLSKEVSRRYTSETVGKIEEDDYNLTAIDCTKDMFNSYVRTVSLTVEVNVENKSYEEKNKFYIPEWMFEDRQNDLDNLYKRYKEE